jgi:hypothetical protein
MYGFGSYGTNAYASKRVEIIYAIRRIGARTLRSFYGIARTLRLPFKRTLSQQ